MIASQADAGSRGRESHWKIGGAPEPHIEEPRKIHYLQAAIL